MEKPYLSIIIPAYNESKRLPHTLEDIDVYLRAVKFGYEILVIDDGSTDGTAQIAQGMSAQIKNMKVVQNDRNRGKGAVVRDGMLLAQGEVRLFMDADNSTSLNQFENMRQYLDNGFDVVIGSRAVRGAKLMPAQPLSRRAPSIVGNFLIQVMLLPGVWDTQCGFKAFTDKAAVAVFTKMRVFGWGFDIEVLALARAMGFKIKEMPVIWVNDLNSRFKSSAYLRVLLETFKIRLWLWRGIYQLKMKK